MKNSMDGFFLRNLKLEIHNDPAILLMSMYLKEMRAGRDRPSMFIIKTHAEPYFLLRWGLGGWKAGG